MILQTATRYIRAIPREVWAAIIVIPFELIKDVFSWRLKDDYKANRKNKREARRKRDAQHNPGVPGRRRSGSKASSRVRRTSNGGANKAQS